MTSAVSWSDHKGKSPLHLAVINGKIATVTKLVSSDGCDINAIDNNFQTPLHCAARLGLTEIVKYLCDHGADAERGDHNRRTPLHYAARENFADTIAALLTVSQQLVGKQDIDGNSALFWAVNQDAFDAVSTLHKFHADLHQVGQNGATVLHAAAIKGNLQMVELLLLSEACVDPKDKRGMTPLMYACEMSYPKIVRRLMRAGADIMLLDGEGRSTLHWAAIGGQPDVCVALRECGLDVNVRDNFGRTPLHLAASKDKMDCAWALIQNGANCDEQDHEGMTALHWACKNGSLAIVVLLINFSSNINAMKSTPDRFTPLNLAFASQQNPDVIQHLIEQGALPIEHIRELAACAIQAYFRNYLKRKQNLDRQRIMKTQEDNDSTSVSGSSVVEEKRKPTQDLSKDELAKAKKRYKKRTQRHGNQTRKLAASEASSIENFHKFAMSPELKTVKHKTKRFQSSPSVKSDSPVSTSKQLGTSFESDDSGKKCAISKRIPGLFDKSRFKLILKKGKKSVAKDEKPQDEEVDREESEPYDEELLKMLEVRWHERLHSAQCTKMPSKM